MLKYIPKLPKKNYNFSKNGTLPRLGKYLLILGCIFGGLHLFFAGASILIPKHLSQEQEQKLFGDVSIEEDFGTINPKQTDFVRKIVRNLERQHQSTFKNDVYAVCNDDINAFATIGGKIIVYSGAIRKLSENGLTFVIGHEFSHIQHRDPLQQLIKSTPFIMFDVFFDGFSSVAFNDFLDLKYNKDIELRSDREGAQAVLSKYGHAGGIDEFFHIIDEGKVIDTLQILTDHPMVANRIKQMELLTKGVKKEETNEIDFEIANECYTEIGSNK